MPDQPQTKRPHFILQDTSRAVGFTARSTPVPQKATPVQPRQQHGASLQEQIKDLKLTAAAVVRVQKELQLESGLGLQIQFTSQPDVALAFESLANANKPNTTGNGPEASEGEASEGKAETGPKLTFEQAFAALEASEVIKLLSSRDDLGAILEALTVAATC